MKREEGKNRLMLPALLGGHAWKIVQLTVSIGLVVLLATTVDCASALDAAGLARSRTLVEAFSLILFAHVVSAVRLHLLLEWQNSGVGFGQAAKLTFAGLFAGNFLPSTVGGDAVKFLGLTRSGLSKEVAAASITMDRVISLIAMLLLLPTAVLAPRLLGAQERLGVALAFALGLILSVVFLAVVSAVGSREQKDTAGKGGIWWLRSWIQGTAYRFRLNLQFLKANPMAAVTAMALSCGFFLLAILALWLLAMDLGIQISYLEMTATLAIAYFASLIPVSLNGLGIQEASLVLLLGHLGASPPQSLALAGMSRIFHIASSLPGAWVLVGFGKKST